MKNQDKGAEIKFFDKFDREGGYDVFDKTGYLKIVKIVKEKITPKEGMVIYDMGCGSGVFTSYLAQSYPDSKIVGIDISRGCVQRAKIDFPNIEFRTGDVESTKLKSNSVDFVSYSGILHHFPDFSKVAEEAYRILKPGGHFFSYDPNYYNPAFWLYRSKSSPFYSARGITKNERLLKPSEIKRVFSNYGFETKTMIISGLKFCYLESKTARLMLSVYNVCDQILGATLFSNFIGAFILGFGKKT